MKSLLRLPLVFCFLWSSVNAVRGQGEASRGEWKPPSADGKPWKHAPTGLSFPQQLDGYRLTGEFEYREGGRFIRYENLDERARADVFLFASPPAPGLEDRHRLILKEMDAVVTDLKSMADSGRYKNVQMGELSGGKLELWQKEALPIATRVITATRIGTSEEGVGEAIIKQWVGITHLGSHLLTIRHLRPADTGDEGEAGMKTFLGRIFQVIKDPPLRAEVLRLVEVYLNDPWSDEGMSAARMVMTYLDQTPFYPIGLPEEPISSWLERCKAKAEGSETHLLRAFMIGSAKAALADHDAEASLNEACRQFARIYRELLPKHPQIADPEMDNFAVAAEKGEGAAWLRVRGLKQR
jgi:hypothetical protein